MHCIIILKGQQGWRQGKSVKGLSSLGGPGGRALGGGQGATPPEADAV